MFTLVYKQVYGLFCNLFVCSFDISAVTRVHNSRAVGVEVRVAIGPAADRSSKEVGAVNRAGVHSNSSNSNNGETGKVTVKETTVNNNRVTVNRATATETGAVGINSITISIGDSSSRPVKHPQLVAKL